MKTFRQFSEQAYDIEEDSRRTSNKQHTQRVKANIKSFGSNYTPPSNWVPDAGPSGEGEVLTPKQIKKLSRKALRNQSRGGRSGRGGGGFSSLDTATPGPYGIGSFDPARLGGV